MKIVMTVTLELEVGDWARAFRTNATERDVDPSVRGYVQTLLFDGGVFGEGEVPVRATVT
jgi:hypothetical protein